MTVLSKEIHHARAVCVLAAILLGLILSNGLLAVGAQGSFTNITSYRVNQTPNYSLPGSEPFWAAISWTNVPLAASVSPGGGHTTNVLVKSANDGYNIYVLFRWNDSEGFFY